MMKTRRIILAVTALALVGIGMLVPSLRGKESPIQTGPTEEEMPWVEIAEIRQSSEAIPVAVTGMLHRREESVLAFHKGGMLEEVLVRPGDSVKRGDVLARLRLDEMDAALGQARARVGKSQRDVARFEDLQKQRAVSLESLENARTELEVAEAELRIADFGRRYAEIQAPDDGIILERRVEPDEWVDGGAPVIGFASDRSGWIVKVSLAEPDARVLSVGDAAVFGALKGRVARISGTADPATGTVAIEVNCDEVPDETRSRQVVSGRIFPKSVGRRSYVPSSALIAANEGACRVFLWSGETGTVRDVRVTVADFLEGMAYMAPELAMEREWVVVEGAEYLRDGMKVRRAAEP